jgi:AraC-like DNA-binding protein
VLPLGGTIIIYGLAYLGLRQPETTAGSDAPTPADEVAVQPAKKYEKSTLTSERSEFYLKKLLSIMETEKPYTDGDLTLSKLASKLSISAHHLSQIINERLKQNFFDFVNTYRVAEAKRKLVDPAKKHYSLLAIAEEVGFNSKSAFNVAFKKQTNMTPSEFRKASNGNGQH